MEKPSRRPPPIVIPAYRPDLSGNVEYFNDVYDRDTRLMQALDTTEAVRSPTS